MSAVQDFPHQQTAHCETGVMSALLRHHGLSMDEAFVFGLGRGLSFAFIPVLKLSGMPLIAYRSMPRAIIRNTCRALGLRLQMQKFASPDAGMRALDAALDAGRLVGLQTSVFWLPYFPPEMRFHFNAHNLLVYGRDGDDYLISDPVFEQVQRCPRADLQRARFARGALAARGLMYTVDEASLPQAAELSLKPLLRQAMVRNARHMLPPAPVFFAGVNGIRTLARRVQALPASGHDDAFCKLFLGHIVRMQEEIGTGGAGFRYLYAFFLQQVAEQLQQPVFQQHSRTLTDIGDAWRLMASQAVRQCRRPTADGHARVADSLHDIACREAAFWRQLRADALAL